MVILPTMAFDRVVLGRTGLEVSRIGLSAGYGIGGADVERAFERGINFLYWGSYRRPDFGKAISRLARRHRDDMVVVLQSYSRSKLALGPSVDRALKKLGLDHADILILGWWNKLPPERILDGAMALCEAGKIGHIAISCHHRPSFEKYIADPRLGAIMVRYNAAHRGAEREVFPFVDSHVDPPGVIAYTATRWGKLLDPEFRPVGESPVRAADCYRFVLSHPQVTMSLAGPKNGEELEDALLAIDKGPMDEDELAWMRRVGDAVHAAKGVKVWRSPSLAWDRIATAIRGGRS